MIGLIVIAVVFAVAAAVGDPKKVTRYELEVEWRPTYCMMNYCPDNWKINEFAITSLRPLGRSNSEVEDCLCDESITSLKYDTKRLLEAYFPSRDIESLNLDLWTLQWTKYGCCMESRDRPNRYFKRAVEMFQALTILEKLEMKKITPGGMANLEDFRAAFGRKISLSCLYHQLTKVRFFYSLTFDWIDAHEEEPREDECGSVFSFPALSEAKSIEDL